MSRYIFTVIFVGIFGCLLLDAYKIRALSSLSVEISEVLPNPAGDDASGEWIELRNTTDAEINFDGWTVADRYGAVKTFSLDGKRIGPFGMLVLERTETGITLNNDQEQVVLRSLDGEEELTPLMTSIPEGKSFAKIGNSWDWADPSKGIYIDAPSQTPQQSPFISPTPQSSQTPAESSQPTPTPTSAARATLELSEFQACDAGVHEWIEIRNKSSWEAGLEDWRLLDASGVLVQNMDGVKIPSSGYAIIELPSTRLNNGGDMLRLQYGETDVDQFAYSYCTSGRTWMKNNQGQWIETQCPTRGTANMECSSTTQAAQEYEGDGGVALKQTAQNFEKEYISTTSSFKKPQVFGVTQYAMPANETFVQQATQSAGLKQVKRITDGDISRNKHFVGKIWILLAFGGISSAGVSLTLLFKQTPILHKIRAWYNRWA